MWNCKLLSVHFLSIWRTAFLIVIGQFVYETLIFKHNEFKMAIMRKNKSQWYSNIQIVKRMILNWNFYLSLVKMHFLRLLNMSSLIFYVIIYYATSPWFFVQVNTRGVVGGIPYLKPLKHSNKVGVISTPPPLAEILCLPLLLHKEFFEIFYYIFDPF